MTETSIRKLALDSFDGTHKGNALSNRSEFLGVLGDPDLGKAIDDAAYTSGVDAHLSQQATVFDLFYDGNDGRNIIGQSTDYRQIAIFLEISILRGVGFTALHPFRRD